MAHDAFTTSTATPVQTTRHAVAPGPWFGVVKRWAALLARWHAAHRSRSRLAQLPPELLRDVGLTEDTARRELDKPFWR
ncbi:MAG: DUF1127 domain-containing protein [Pseudomonadota bacterium]